MHIVFAQRKETQLFCATKKQNKMKLTLLTLVCSLLLCMGGKAQIIISQYYEGGGTNKWIELTNLGTSAVNTASPQLRLGIWSASGSTGNIAFTGSPSATLDLNVTIPAKGSVLIGNPSNGSEVGYLAASSAVQTSTSVIAFNGNDGIALLNSSNTVLDRFGTGINASDVSYVRSTAVTAASATYTSSQWTSTSLTTVNSASASSPNRLGYHVSPNCSTPTAATGLTFTTTSSSVSGSFSASGTSDSYLVLRTTATAPTVAPSNATNYTAGSTLGNATVVAYGTSKSFSSSSLVASTTYYFHVFVARTGCTGAPVYSSSLSSSATTSATGGGTGGGPAGYYNNAASLTCQPLKTALKTIISTGFNTLSYTPGIWNIFYSSDKRRNDANTADIVWDMYSDRPSGAEPYTYTLGTNQCGSYSGEGGCYNREHSTPQSWFNSASPMVSDAHHIFATDGAVNALRSNFPYGEVSSATNTSQNGSKLGTGTTNFGFTGTVFEPINEYKGDFARAALYMAVRYEDEIISQNWSSLGTANAVFLSSTDQSNAATRRLQIYDPWFLQLMIKWHNQDPVSQKEIDRNNAIYNNAVVNSSGGATVKQNNRNPFVDNPSYVTSIWGTGNGGVCNANLISTATPQKFSFFPNPSAAVLNVVVNETVRFVQIVDATGLVYSTQRNMPAQKKMQLNTDSLRPGSYLIQWICETGIISAPFTKQ